MQNSTVIQNFHNLRNGTHNLVKEMGAQRVQAIPAGASNNILWNFGHIITDGAEMLYQSNDIKSPVPETLRPLFVDGTSPSQWETTPDINHLLEISDSFTTILVQDYNSGKFQNFDPKKVESAWPLIE